MKAGLAELPAAVRGYRFRPFWRASPGATGRKRAVPQYRSGNWSLSRGVRWTAIKPVHPPILRLGNRRFVVRRCLGLAFTFITRGQRRSSLAAGAACGASGAQRQSRKLPTNSAGGLARDTFSIIRTHVYRGLAGSARHPPY